MNESLQPGPRTRAYVAWTLKHARMLWAVALLLAIPAIWRTTSQYIHLRSDLQELLPPAAPSVVAIDELRARMPGLKFLGVVVDMGDAANAEAAETFLDELATKIRAYPPELVRAVYTGSSEEKAFLESHAPLYVTLADLKTIRARIEARRDYEASKETGTLLDDDSPAPSVEFDDIQKKYDAQLPKGGESEHNRYLSTNLKTAVLLVEVGGFSVSGSSADHKLFAKVKSDVAAMGGPAHYAPGMRIGYAGDVAISVEELSALVQDLSVSSVIVLIAVVAVILLYYRWSRSIVALIVPLLVATVYAFGLSSLPPFDVTELNSNTAFLGSIIVGNGINFGIVLLARYVEERRAGRSVEEALAFGVHGARVGTLSAALAAGVSYASLAVTTFRGFRQFGYIGGLGMVTAWICAFLLMPPLIAALDRNPSHAPKAVKEEGRLMAYLARFVTRNYRFVTLVGVVVVGLAALELRTFSIDRDLEYDFSKLRRADTWVNGEGYWGRRMDAVLGQYLTPTVILCDDVKQAEVIAGHLRESMKTPPLSDMISSIRTIDDVLPIDQPAKIAEAAAIRDDMTPKMRSLIAPAKRDSIDKLLGPEDLKPVSVGDLPHRFTTATIENDGTMGRTVLVYPRPSKALWQGPGIEGFTRVLRDAAAAGGGARPARVAGSLPLSADILGSIRHDGTLASAAAFLGVVLVVLLLFRWHATTIYVVGALLVGVLWLAAATMVFHVKINFANFIAFPITFGIGVDYSVNVVSRYIADGEKDVAATIRSTGSAVALCSLTTIIGYSSLLIAENRALFLFGVVAVFGEIACLSAALTLMPAVLTWRAHNRDKKRNAARAPVTSATDERSA